MEILTVQWNRVKNIWKNIFKRKIFYKQCSSHGINDLKEMHSK